MIRELFVNAGPPQSVQVRVTSGDSGHNLASVTSAVFKVVKPDGSTADWVAGISLQSATGLTLTHELAAGGADVSLTGKYKFYPKLTLPTGSIDADAEVLIVVNPLAP